VLKRIVDTLRLRSLMLRHRSIGLPGVIQSAADHQEQLMRAYEARDGDLAAALQGGSARFGLRVLETWLEQNGDALSGK
jgi:hypothetical protein